MKSLGTFVAIVALLIAAQAGAVAQEPRLYPEKDAYFAAENERFAERSKPAKEMLKKAYAYRDAGDLKRAEETALQVMRMGYVGGYARLMLVKIYLGQRRYQDALTLCKPYLDEPTNHEEELDYLLGLCLLRLGRADAARKLYSGSIVHIVVFERDATEMARYLPSWDSARGAEANFLFALGVLYISSASDKESFAYLEAASKLAPYNGVIALYTARKLEALHRMPEALSYYRRAAASGPAHLRKEAVERLPREERAQYKSPDDFSDATMTRPTGKKSE